NFASCGADRAVKIHGAPAPDGEPLDDTGKPKREFKNFADPITALAYSHDGRTLAVGGRDSTIRVLDLNTGQTVRTFLGHGEEITALRFSPVGNQLASASFDQTVRLWNLEPVDAHRTFLGSQGA